VLARLDAALRVVFVSPNVVDLTGYAPHQLLGLKFGAPGWLLHPDDARQLGASALDPAARAAQPAAVMAAAGGRRRAAPARLRALARMGWRGSADYAWVEMMLTHTFGSGSSPGGGALQAVTISMRELEWHQLPDADDGGGQQQAHGAEAAGL
jgi:PAS domain-containing protein